MKRIFPISLTLTGLLTASLVTFIALALICVKQAVAHTYHSHKPVKPVTMTAEQMSELVNQSTHPDFNEQDLAPIMATLVKLAKEDRITHQERLVYARLLQHQHQFADARQSASVISVACDGGSRVGAASDLFRQGAGGPER